MARGWHFEPSRHSLAARGFKTIRKTYRDYRLKPWSVSELDIKVWDDAKKDHTDNEILEELIPRMRETGFFEKLKCDGKPHLKRGASGFGIAYKVDLDNNTIDFMDISDITSSTGDPYWTEDQVNPETWATKHNRAHVITQYVSIDIIDLIEGVIKNERWVGSYGSPDKLIDLTISYVAYHGGEEAVFHSRQEAYDYFEEMAR